MELSFGLYKCNTYAAYLTWIDDQAHELIPFLNGKVKLQFTFLLTILSIWMIFLESNT